MTLATDPVQAVAEAVVAVVNADTILRALMTAQALANGKTLAATDPLIVPWRDAGDNPLPIIAYEVIFAARTGGTGRQTAPLSSTPRRVRATVQFTAFTEGNNAQATANGMCERLELGVTASLLAAQGLDAWPLSWLRRPRAAETDGARRVYGADFDLTLDLSV